MASIPFQKFSWQDIPTTMHAGASGVACWQTVALDGLRIRIVEYPPGYFADHWCAKGHIVHCLEGSFISELISGEQVVLAAGDMYVVSDDQSEHRSFTGQGAKLLIVDGDFLKAG